MNINSDALKALELKLAEYGKANGANGAIAEHVSFNNDYCNGCARTCKGLCHDDGCGSSCWGTAHGRHN